MSHPHITNTPLRLHLRTQLSRLERVISGSDQPWSVAQARRYHSRVRHYAECEPDTALVDLRGWLLHDDPAIDDVCRHMEQPIGFEREAHTGLVHMGEAA